MPENDPFDFELLDAHPIAELPCINQVPEFLVLDDEPEFPFPQPHPTPHPAHILPVQVLDHENNPVVVDANTGGVLHVSNDLPEDVPMPAAPTRHLPVQEAVDHAHHAIADPQAPLEHREQAQNAHAVNAAEPGHLHEDTPLANARATGKRKKRSTKAEAVKNGTMSAHAPDVPTAMLQANVYAPNVTDTNPIPPEMASVHQHTPMGSMQADAQPHSHAHMNMTTPLPPSQVNVSHVSHINTLRAAAAPQPAGRPTQQNMSHPALPTQAQLQQDASNSASQLITPNSPLDRLPGRLQELLMVHARHQSYVGAEARAVNMAQNAAVKIHTMIETGALSLDYVVPNTTDATVHQQQAQPSSMQPPPKVRRTKSKSSSKGNSNKMSPRQSPAPQMVAAQPQAAAPNMVPVNALGEMPQTAPFHPMAPAPQAAHHQTLAAVSAQYVAQLSVPNTPAFSNVTRVPSHDHSHVSAADYQSTHMAVRQHPVTPVVGGNVGTDRAPKAQGHACQCNHHHYPAQGALRNHPKRPVTPVHPSQPITAKHPKYYKQSMSSMKPPVTPVRSQHQPQQLKTAAMNLTPGAGPSKDPEAEGPLTIFKAVKDAILETLEEMDILPVPFPDEVLRASAGPSTATFDELVEKHGLAAPGSGFSFNNPSSHKGKKLRFSKNAGPSKYCHICGRSAMTVAVAYCANLPVGICRKIICEKCLIIHDPEYAGWARNKNSGWMCIHCRHECPGRARCFQYTRNNERRRQKNEEKKRQKRLQQQLEGKPETKRRRRNNDRQDNPGVSPTGVADNVF